MGIIDRYISTEVDWKAIQRLCVIGIDEIALKKGHKDFVTIVTMRVGNETRILAVLKDRKKETVKAFFSRIPTRIRKTVRAVCSDMYDGFINLKCCSKLSLLFIRLCKISTNGIMWPEKPGVIDDAK